MGGRFGRWGLSKPGTCRAPKAQWGAVRGKALGSWEWRGRHLGGKALAGGLDGRPDLDNEQWSWSHLIRISDISGYEDRHGHCRTDDRPFDIPQVSDLHPTGEAHTWTAGATIWSDLDDGTLGRQHPGLHKAHLSFVLGQMVRVKETMIFERIYAMPCLTKRGPPLPDVLLLSDPLGVHRLNRRQKRKKQDNPAETPPYAELDKMDASRRWMG
ncbi:hypothetical protein VTK73DRAFT_9556 [Phialemonium thermophilum]|uniref:Uncharacterized protein n=1 Tax=Phialemonium thermophilum TaxID=223376 RepID=A0ABR3W1Q1_9PEZI